MLTKQVSLALAAAISILIGSTMAWSYRADWATTSRYETKIDFDQAFAHAAWRGTFEPSMNEKLREAGLKLINATTQSQSGGDVAVNRVRKGDRLPMFKAEPVLHACEPVASPYVDPALGQIAGRCVA
jgi:hypothetical protein